MVFFSSVEIETEVEVQCIDTQESTLGVERLVLARSTTQGRLLWCFLLVFNGIEHRVQGAVYRYTGIEIGCEKWFWLGPRSDGDCCGVFCSSCLELNTGFMVECIGTQE